MSQFGKNRKYYHLQPAKDIAISMASSFFFHSRPSCRSSYVCNMTIYNI